MVDLQEMDVRQIPTGGIKLGAMGRLEPRADG
jgi:hypothetical protein